VSPSSYECAALVYLHVLTVATTSDKQKSFLARQQRQQISK